MSIKAIRLFNFMAFADSGWVELRDITLLFGLNSSGKSAIIRALLLLRQSLTQDAEEEGALRFTDADGVDVGSFGSVIHNNHLQGSQPGVITFGLRLANTNVITPLRNLLKLVDPLLSEDEVATYYPEVYLSMVSDINPSVASRVNLPALYKVELFLTDKKGQQSYPVLEGESHTIKTDNIGTFQLDRDKGWQVSSDNSELQEGLKLDPTIAFSTTNGFFPRLESDDDKRAGNQGLESLVSLFQGAHNSCNTFLAKQLKYIGPLRPRPERIYLTQESKKRNYLKSSSTIFFALLADLVSPDQRRALDRWVEKLKLGAEIKVVPDAPQPDDPQIVEGGRVTALYIKESLSSAQAINIADMGFGASQVLPIVVACLTAVAGDLIIIEQPELHLHPRAQAELGDLFIEAINRNTAGDSPIKFLIETHSENLLLRVRRRIAETSAQILGQSLIQKLSISQLKVLYVWRSQARGKSEIEEIIFDQWGDYLYRPTHYGDFFGQDFEEITKLKKAKRESQVSEVVE